MAILEILEYPDSRLRTRAAPVTTFDDELRRLADDMLETMYDAPGVGLAATQVNVHRQLVVIDVSEARSSPIVLINPIVLPLSTELQEWEEGCLSVPGFHDTVTRPRYVRVKAQGFDGSQFEFEPEGLLAVCIQHELDHLHGKLFVDHLSPLKRQRIRKKIEKQQKQA